MPRGALQHVDPRLKFWIPIAQKEKVPSTPSQRPSAKNLSLPF